MQAIENNNVNETEKQLLRTKTKMLLVGSNYLNKANTGETSRIIPSVKKIPNNLNYQITSINKLVE
jgi:hypothetical protein